MELDSGWVPSTASCVILGLPLFFVGGGVA